MTSFRRRWPNAAGVVSAGPPGGGVVHTSLTASVTDARSRAGRCLPVEGSGRQGSDVPAVTQRLRLVALPVESLAYVTAHISLVRVRVTAWRSHVVTGWVSHICPAVRRRHKNAPTSAGSTYAR